MSKPFQLHIPTPCHENWDEMTKVEKGKFCRSCQKPVVDFTRMSDEQLVAFFKRRSTGSVCGRFMQDQLDRSMEIPKKRIPWVKYFFQFALPAFLLSTKATAQGKVRVLTGDTIVAPVFPKINTEKKSTACEQEKERIIRGRVVDDGGEGISYATISIKGTTIGVAADSTGNFSLKYNGNEDTCVLISSCVGFQAVETLVSLNMEEGAIAQLIIPREISMKDLVMGAIMLEIGDMVIPDYLLFDTNVFIPASKKISSLNKLPKIYPNPLKTNTTLTVQMSRDDQGSYLFQLLAMNGQVMLSKELWIDENGPVVKINIPPVTMGAYFLQIINKQSGKRTTEKIMVE